MNTYNIALENEQNQRLVDDQFAIETQVDRDTNLYIQGKADAVFGTDPEFPEKQEYWAGYCEELQQIWIKKNNPVPTELCHKVFQGYLYLGSSCLSRKYGKITILGEDGDYKGWSIEIEGLEIEVVTFDWEEAEKELKWAIYSHHVHSLELLAKEFGEEKICDGNTSWVA